jgi:hypothetical protein
MNDAMEIYYSSCWWISIIKSYHGHESKYVVFVLKSVQELDIDASHI